MEGARALVGGTHLRRQLSRLHLGTVRRPKEKHATHIEYCTAMKVPVWVVGNT